jgi:hypothetical protein
MEIKFLSVKNLTRQRAGNVRAVMALSNFSLDKTFIARIVGRRLQQSVSK